MVQKEKTPSKMVNKYAELAYWNEDVEERKRVRSGESGAKDPRISSVPWHSDKSE
jgi:hypothetical protein